MGGTRTMVRMIMCRGCHAIVYHVYYVSRVRHRCVWCYA